jgi:hypothetical protein
MSTSPHSQPLEPGDPFQLQSPPDELWNLSRLCNEFGVSKPMIYEWIRLGRLPQPWLRRKGKSFWAPETVWPALERYWHRMGRDKQEA